MKTVLCYGDSNTHGSNPDGGDRFGLDVRWGSVLRKQLGDGYWVIEEGLGGRTAIWDDPIEPNRNGKTYLAPCLMSHRPVDLVALLLGTNDLKHRFGLSAYDIASGAGVLVDLIQRSECGPDGGAPQVLLICPPPVFEVAHFAEMFAGGAEKSQHLARYYKQQADTFGCAFLDAGQVIVSSKLDGIHLEADQHHKLGLAVAEKVRAILG
jgi:lysophospholipase L1-like esterase